MLDRSEASAQEALNSRAFMALMGLSEDCPDALLSLLRSDTPINPAVRQALAQAIEGTSHSGVRLRLEGHRQSADWMRGMAKREEWFQFGQEIAPLFAEESNVTNAKLEAEELTGRDASYCLKAYYYYRYCSQWLGRALGEGFGAGVLTTEQLRAEYHRATILQNTNRPAMPSGIDFNRSTSERWRECQRDFEHLGDLAPEVIFNLWWLYEGIGKD